MDADLDAAARCLLEARYVIALTGAGLSVESGIPPFRGPNGLWTKYGEPPMNGYERFLADPKKAWEDRMNPSGTMRELWDALASAEPNPGHRALVELEDMDVGERGQLGHLLEGARGRKDGVAALLEGEDEGWADAAGATAGDEDGFSGHGDGYAVKCWVEC